MLSGLTLNGARALGDGGGDHARSVAAFLTGAHPKKTDGADIHNGVSVDQVAAGKIGMQTKLPSLELGLERSAQGGTMRFGIQLRLHLQHVLAIPHFARGQGSRSGRRLRPSVRRCDEQRVAASRSRQDRYKTSVLDLVMEDAQPLQGTWATPTGRSWTSTSTLCAISNGESTTRPSCETPKPVCPITRDRPACPANSTNMLS